MKTLTILLLALIGVTNAEANSVHLIQSEDEFKNMTAKGNVMVKFFAPWCGHCKRMAPEYEAAAKILKNENIEDVTLAKVDCTDKKMKDLCSTQKVTGYPTVKFFKLKKESPLSYEGQRVTKDIVSFVKKVVHDAVSVLTSQKELDNLLKDNKMVIVEYGKEVSKRFKQVAENLYLTYSFAHVQDNSLIKEHKMENDTIAMFKTFDDAKVVFSDKMHKLKDWIDHHSFPILGEMNGENYRKYFEKNKPIFWIAIEKKNKKALEEIEKLKPVFKEFKNKIFAVFIDGPEFKDALKSMGFTDAYPNAMLIDKDEKFKFEGKIDSENVKKFLGDFEKKTLKRFFRSEKAPAKDKGPVYTVVGDTFNKIVMDEETDVVLEYYLTYCKHCKNFEPEYKKVGELFKNEPFIRIAKINGEENDTPIKVTGYPKVIMFRAGKKDDPLHYNGDMKADKVEKWILKNSPLLKNAAKKQEKEKEPEKTAEKKEL